MCLCVAKIFTCYVVTSLTCILDLLIIVSCVQIHLGSRLPTVPRRTLATLICMSMRGLDVYLMIMLYVRIRFGIELCTASWLAR